MEEADILKLLVAVIVGGAATLIGKIMFDWLKNRGAGAAPVVSGSLVTSKNCASNHKELNTWKSGVDKCLVQHKGTIESHEKRLDRGADDFVKIRESLAGLNTSYEVLAATKAPKK